MHYKGIPVERVTGIEPASSAWELKAPPDTEAPETKHLGESGPDGGDRECPDHPPHTAA